MYEYDTAMIRDALTGNSDECGDDGIIIEEERTLFVALMDALGHGREAHKVVSQAGDYIRQHFREELTVILSGLNDHMQGTRGLVAGLCRISRDDGSIQFSGIGNISTRIHGKENYAFRPREGIVGYLMPHPRRLQYDLAPGDILILSSDGIKERLPLIDKPDLLQGSSKEIAYRLIRELRNRDDASCLVVRCRKCRL